MRLAVDDLRLCGSAEDAPEAGALSVELSLPPQAVKLRIRIRDTTNAKNFFIGLTFFHDSTLI